MNGTRESEDLRVDDGELPPFSTALWTLVRPRELVVLAVFPVLIAGTFLLPEETKRALTFAYTDPTVITAYVSHFVHLRSDHLLANMLGYALVVPTTYLLSVLASRRRLFWTMFATVWLAGPFVLSGLNLAFPRAAIGYGSSGLIMAFFGILPVALYNYVRPLFVSDLRSRDLPVLFFLVVGIISGIVLPRSDATVAIAVVSGVLAVVYGGYIFVRERRARKTFGSPARPVRPFGYVELPVVGVILLVGYPLVGFPSELVAANRVVNLYVHFLGFAVAFVATYVGEVTHVLAETSHGDAE
ncbi:hypothetical protein AArcSl_1122 [Halalkaliarchaeum desulfuricum]|uniref:Rhomboid family protein n=1 Tax=Halalkaliarchaeum desulfuricum TaxID=2055893 RepID=A0A343TI35_9EURY|nr:hypothetical protein [Halalkaliarchaeum desulfuricum]AUX08757.1 hypothetical protein AArcSl_1122 [Halalkaliarchaeum desulfuricum]